MPVSKAGLEAFRPAAAAMVAALFLLPWAKPLAAQQPRDVVTVQPQVGIVNNGAPHREGENRWGWLAGVRTGIPVAGRVLAIATLHFMKIGNELRITGNQGSFVYAEESVVASAGVGYDLFARQTTRLIIAAEVGPVWSRHIETARFGSPRPELGLSDQSFQLSAVGIASVDLQQILAPPIALDLSLRGFIGDGAVAPAFGLGLAFRIP